MAEIVKVNFDWAKLYYRRNPAHTMSCMPPILHVSLENKTGEGAYTWDHDISVDNHYQPMQATSMHDLCIILFSGERSIWAKVRIHEWYCSNTCNWKSRYRVNYNSLLMISNIRPFLGLVGYWYLLGGHTYYSIFVVLRFVSHTYDHTDSLLASAEPF
jgi:hypothetical protein